MPQHILLTGGEIVTATSVEPADILIDGEIIAAVGPHLDVPADVPRIDISGLTVLPGLIDAHTHLREPGATHKEDFTSGTRAALAGGVTTVFAMPNTDPPITDRATFEQAASLAASKAVCDVGLYIGAMHDNAAEAAALSDRAIGLKMYMGSSTGSLLVDKFASQFAHFAAYPHDRILAVHAEDEQAVQYYVAQGEHRPPICAALAVARAIALAEQTDRRLHVCHVSTPYELQLIRDAKERGARITAEVCPHHLFLSTADRARLGPYGKVNPPLRSPESVAALWDLLSVADTVGTDHAPHTRPEKDGAQPPSGMPGLEAMLPLLLTAVHDGHLTLPNVVRLTASRPAELFALSGKGRVAPGFSADLALVDLTEAWTLTKGDLFTRCGWSPYEGRSLRGRVKQTYLRGQLAYNGGDVLVDPGYGRLIAPA